MSVIVERAYARAGLLGNPSDGYGGKTLSLILKNFWAEVQLQPDDRLTLIPNENDYRPYQTVHDLVADVRRHGYYGGLRLLKAAVKRCVDYLADQDLPHARGFSLQYRSNIPRNVGLGGSSAIVVAALKALARYYQLALPPDILAALALSVETDELGIPAGMQDRVIQAYEGLVFMDFSPTASTECQSFRMGRYQPMDPNLLPPLYVAYADQFGEPTEMLHSDLRARFSDGDPQVIKAMLQFAEIAEQGCRAIQTGDFVKLGQLIDANFDLRQTICRLHPVHVRLVETARQTGASAKYCGSGGAIIGTCDPEGGFERLVQALERIHCHVIRPSF